MVRACSSSCPSVNTNNLRLVLTTQWSCASANCGQTVVRDEVSVYYAKGITEVNGNTILPVFVINYGQVQASDYRYEDDGGLSDSNGPTMIQYINITNNPPNTWIYEWCPNNFWQQDCYGTVIVSNSISTTIIECCVSATVTASMSVSYKVYRIEGRTGPTPNQSYINVWCWALNEGGKGWWAQTKWTWPTMTVIYTPANGKYCPLNPEYTIKFVVMTIGNFWDGSYPWTEQHGPGAGWVVQI
ncbi:hypothetical protein [Acidianus ambivalens]|uniref:Uncharacterized protein n=1 Tax=Acidianus ambivalens TaxID=2283 RepID=A0A650CWM6_ACIAM|nr:hypothetical protein [Acidianus ambivalens]MQL54364.1 hypothetical protein [Acidianus ambivalens]QGR22188.1 hypothetical protein D1866_09490 [Acidianus ambivalens]